MLPRDADTVATVTRNPSPALLVTTQPRVQALFAASFGTTAGIILFLLQLRRGIYELEQVSIFNALFLLYDYWPAIIGLLLTAIALLRPVQLIAFRLVSGIGRQPLTTALVTFVGLAVASLLVYHAHPLSMDEYAPYFQSQVFAAGKLAGHFPVALMDWLVPPGFQNAFLLASKQTGAVASVYMPGFALLLTPFTFFGVAWLCNPVLGAASVLVVHRLALEIFHDKHAAGLAGLLTVGSSAFSINAISFYSMTAHALANGVYVLLLLQPSPRRCVLAGFVGSLALVLHNPLPHTLFALPWLAWLLVRQDRLRTLSWLAIGYLPLFLLLGVGWTAFSAGFQAQSTLAATDTLGFVDRWTQALSAFLAVPSSDTLWFRGVGLLKLWIWAAPALIAAAVVGAWQARHVTAVRLLALSCVTTLVGFLFVVFSQGHGWGFRYFHSAWLALPVLAVAATRGDRAAAVGEPHTTAAFLGATGLLALLVLLPLHAWQVRSFMDRHLHQVPSSSRGIARVEIVNTATGYYAVDLVQNDPFLREPVIRMVSHGRKADAEIMATHFPGFTRLSRGASGEVWGEVVTAP